MRRHLVVRPRNRLARVVQVVDAGRDDPGRDRRQHDQREQDRVRRRKREPALLLRLGWDGRLVTHLRLLVLRLRESCAGGP